MDKLMKMIKNNKLFLKILLSFLSLLIPIIIIGTFTYVNFVDQLKNDYNQEIMTGIEASAETVDQHLNKIHEVGINFFSDPTVVKLLKPTPLFSKEDRADLAQLSKSLALARFHLNPFVDEMFVYADSENVFNVSGINDFSAYFQSFYQYEQYDAAFWSSKLNLAKYMEVLKPALVQTAFSKQEVLTFIFTGRMTNSRAVFAITVPVQNIIHAMKVVLESGGSKGFVTDGDGQVIALSDPEFQHLEAIALIDRDIEERAGQTVIKLENRSMYTATKVTSDTYNWTFYVVKPIEEFHAQASNILTMIIVICILLIVVGCLFSFVYAYKIYKPIVKIGQILMENQADTKEAADPLNDFNQIGAGVHQLIHYQHRFKNDLQKITDDYVNHSLLSLMKNGDRSVAAEEELSHIMSEKLSFHQDSYRCCAITFTFTNKFYEEIQDVHRILIQSKIKLLITGFFDRDANIHVIECEKFLYLCVGNVDSATTVDPFYQGLQLLIQTFSNDRHYCNIHVGVGETYAGLGGITHSYSDAMSALQSIPQEEMFHIVYANTMQVKHHYQFSKTDEKKLLNILKLGNKDHLSDFLEELFKRNENISFHLRNTLVEEIYEVAMRHVFESEIEIQKFLTEEQQLLLKRQSDLPAELDIRIKELTSLLYELVDYINDIRQRLNKSDLLANSIKQYVEENYCSDLGLETIADSVNVSVKYVSRIFKDKFQINLTDYISQLRIAHAIQLLEREELTISEVSEMVGFYNRTTFLRTFKRIEGVSPNEYRQNMLKQKSEGGSESGGED